MQHASQVLDEWPSSSPGPATGCARPHAGHCVVQRHSGITEQASRLGDRSWRALLDAHHVLLRAELERFGGRKVATTGDGFFATLPVPPVRSAVCAMRDAVHSLGLEIRVGLHTGEVGIVGADLPGIAVHIGARVAAAAQPGEVLVSRTVADLVAGSGIRFRDRGAHLLKGVAR
jgi:class 3 adenylate cyclase